TIGRGFGFLKCAIPSSMQSQLDIDDALIAGPRSVGRRYLHISEALWGTRVSPSTVSDLNKKIYGTIEAWRNRPIESEHPYVYLNGLVLKRSWAGEVRNVSLLVAIGVNNEGYREILGICERRRRTRRAGAVFSSVSRNAASAVSGSSFRTLVWDYPRAPRSSSLTLRGNAVWFMVPQYLQPYSLNQGARDCGDAQGDPRRRGRRSGTAEGCPSDR